MRTHGTLIKWDQARGCGFVRPAHGQGEVCVHIAAFPRDGRPPRIGELISFDLERDAQGRAHAVRVMRPGRAPVRDAFADTPRHRARWRVLALLLVLALGAGVSAYRLIAPRLAERPAAGEAAPTAAAPVPSRQNFHCDGRTHCAQMTSCAEATYFLRNCPGVQMDGNHDGVPCERQWCH